MKCEISIHAKASKTSTSPSSNHGQQINIADVAGPPMTDHKGTAAAVTMIPVIKPISSEQK
jgi:hypothetical protein